MVAAKLVLGGGPLNSAYSTDEAIQTLLGVAREHGIQEIDTAYSYGDSEECLGRLHAAAHFAIDTKHPGGLGADVSASRTESVVEICKQSLSRLQTEQVDVYYIHAPDRRLPFEEMLEGVDQLYKAGAFRRFGLSQFLPAEVEEVVRICQARGYVAPTVYQGAYSAVQRTMEAELLPVLRRHGLCYYAYSASGGGFLAKTPAALRAGAGSAGAGRWDRANVVGALYHGLYADRPATMAALQAWCEIAAAEGEAEAGAKEEKGPGGDDDGDAPPRVVVSGAEMAYRWIVHHSALDGARGDAVIIGAASEEQLRQTLAAVRGRGPLSEGAVARIEALWEGVRAESFLDNFNADEEASMTISAMITTARRGE